MVKKLSVVVVLGLLVSLSLVVTSCDSVLGLVFKPDLTITEVEPLKDATGELTGVRIVFANLGLVGAPAVKYAVVLSGDETISLATDVVIYEDTVTLERGAERQIDLNGETDINPWIESHDVTGLSDGTYFLGAFVDTDDAVLEKEETNNEMASNISFEMTGGGSASGETLTVEIYNAGDLDGFDFMYGVYEFGADPGAVGPIASGVENVQDGSAAALAKTIDNPDETWYGNPGQSYDIYMMVDMDWDQVYNNYIDYSYDFTPLTFTMDDDGVYESIPRTDLSGRGQAHPAAFGVYSTGSHEIFVAPHIEADADCGVDLDYGGPVATYDGGPVLQASFPSADTGWIHFNYPADPDPVMNIAASTNFVFYIDDNAEILGLTGFSLLFFSPSSGFPSVFVDTTGGGYRTATDVGPSSNWDEYTVPLADLVVGGFDPTEMTSFKFGSPNVTGNIYFDNIHFE